jgi:hypothetical protein
MPLVAALPGLAANTVVTDMWDPARKGSRGYPGPEHWVTLTTPEQPRPLDRGGGGRGRPGPPRHRPLRPER